MYLPCCADFNFTVLFVAPLIFVHDTGTVDCAVSTASVQAYH
jgi:hypothetical protein